MRTWVRSVWGRVENLPRPLDDPRGHAPGRNPLRILLIGNGAAVGYGLRSHELALPGQLARHLAEHIERGVEVRSIAGGDFTVVDAAAMLDSRPVESLDAVVVTFGFYEALTLVPPKIWTLRLHALVARLRRDHPELPILFVGPHDIRSVPMFDSGFGAIAHRHAVHLDLLGREMTEFHPATTWESISPLRAEAGDRHRSPSDYAQWGREVAAHLRALLDRSAPGWRSTSPAREHPLLIADDDARAVAVAKFRRLTSSPSADLERIVGLAQKVFGTTGAAITLIDDEKQWMQAVSGVTDTPDGVPREASICFRTIDQDDVMVVPDSALDPRFATGRVTELMRFYAGFPLVSPDGHRLGALCVFDSEPRPDQSIEPSLLREVGMLAQRALWDLAADDERGRGGVQRSDVDGDPLPLS
ncbi:GAF domain-containing protein [Amnibacterium flavum]|uniref:GAF domain-containing protein n=1 Tax=Amnibacterium flavum TaxID=2173173 RepID=A0A2V1HPZ5_9MICO|nr:GAF domain-containing protein [Amnibacterium flavum]PVZ94605.1 hypothetical protein DDQ50_12990 [Amnibacterium flavum]